MPHGSEGVLESTRCRAALLGTFLLALATLLMFGTPVTPSQQAWGTVTCDKYAAVNGNDSTGDGSLYDPW